MRKQILTAVVLATIMVVASPGATTTRYEPNWESLKRHECPAW